MQKKSFKFQTINLSKVIAKHSQKEQLNFIKKQMKNFWRKNSIKNALTSKIINFLKKLQNIIGFIEQKKPVMVSVNITVPCKKRKLWPHYVIIVGFDEKNIFAHNIYPTNQPYQKIGRKIFSKALYSDGMDLIMLVPFK